MSLVNCLENRIIAMNRQDARMRKPFEYVRRPSQKPLNTSTVKVRGSKYRAGDGAYKSTVNCRRVNKERMRIKLARASYVPVAVLLNQHGKPIQRVAV